MNYKLTLVLLFAFTQLAFSACTVCIGLGWLLQDMRYDRQEGVDYKLARMRRHHNEGIVHYSELMAALRKSNEDNEKAQDLLEKAGYLIEYGCRLSGPNRVSGILLQDFCCKNSDILKGHYGVRHDHDKDCFLKVEGNYYIDRYGDAFKEQDEG